MRSTCEQRQISKVGATNREHRCDKLVRLVRQIGNIFLMLSTNREDLCDRKGVLSLCYDKKFTILCVLCDNVVSCL